MKLHLHCSKCFGTEKPSARARAVEVNDEGYYSFVCECGHEQVVIFPIPRYELLLQLGMLAILDGDYGESISKCATGSERFFEFYLRFTWFKQKIPPKEHDATWRCVSKQSERQIGAFLAAYLVENNRSCPFFSNSHFEFRNEVTHRGYIPKRNEAIWFGELVVNFVKDRVQELAQDNKEDLAHFTVKMIDDQRANHPKGAGATSVVMWTVLSESFSAPLGQTFHLNGYLKTITPFRNQW